MTLRVVASQPDAHARHDLTYFAWAGVALLCLLFALYGMHIHEAKEPLVGPRPSGGCAPIPNYDSRTPRSGPPRPTPPRRLYEHGPVKIQLTRMHNGSTRIRVGPCIEINGAGTARQHPWTIHALFSVIAFESGTWGTMFEVLPPARHQGRLPPEIVRAVFLGLKSGRVKRVGYRGQSLECVEAWHAVIRDTQDTLTK